MKLPNGLTSQQIRVLQEFRRKEQEELTLAELDAISHPSGGGGEAPAKELARAGYLVASGETYRLNDRGREFLARPAVPLYGSAAAGGGAAE
jgi:hypothetical protein